MLDERKYAYFQTLRLEARSYVVDAFNRRMRNQADRIAWAGLSLASIDAAAIEYARVEWPKYYDGNTANPLPVSWEHLLFSYSQSPAHFNIAVWQTVDGTNILRGLAVGRPSRAHNHLSINWLESSHVQPPFRGGVLLPILASAEMYAKLLGCSRVLVKNAVDPAAFAPYGYAPFDKPPVGTYLGKEI